MRISTAQIFNRSADNITSTSNSLYEIQQQLSTGKRILKPSDDPLASAQILKLTKEVEKTEQYQDNIDISRRRLSLEETTLDAVNDATVRVKELAIQANSGAVSDTDRALIATELDELEKQLFGLLNTKDVQGEYLFSGYKGFDAAYSYDGATDKYIFNGDEGRRSIQIGPDSKMASTDSGFEIFENVEGVLTISQQTGNQASHFSEQLITDNVAFQAFNDTRGPAVISFGNVGGVGNNPRYSVEDANGDPVFSGDPPVQLSNIEYLPGDVIEFEGASLIIDAPKVNGPVVINTEDQRTNILNMVHELSSALKNISTESDPEGNEKLNSAVSRALLQMESIQEKNIETRGSIGGRINTMDAQQDVNTEFLLHTKDARSSFQDLDYNEAISQFTLQETALNAAYGSFAKIQNLSLFNYIN
ncbi:flagellar hook-associated protein FlgL [Amphritea japonica]|uniref:Flagellar hook-associated protein 3 FlgL n=1 Tax=Amphritea japonica ATCC BAA-1530 TaxID=1278309 RepID=A0A7R6PKG4_9GAMM|nr:flagellar hook-associated protein FlgL [Amphritea japonica]BBB25153.1 flagellar hook-associated protein 3 FlgL [Amphritea japonica ATCC BAA-1530]